MRVYLDNCCLNRPFDDQRQIRIRLEAEAKLYIQENILSGQMELAWSYILDYENAMNPFEERRKAIGWWKSRASIDVEETRVSVGKAKRLRKQGLRNKDALHLACAIAAKCDCFITTDDLLLKHAGNVRGIRVLDPSAFVREVAHDD